MKPIVVSGAIALTLLMSGAFSLIGLASIAVGVAGTAAAATTIVDPSAEALDDIPPTLLPILIAEAGECRGLPWTILAGISKVESDHGRFGGSAIGIDGVVRPSVIGIALDGSEGTAEIADTDAGRWDGDPTWDRAVGPFQFIPSSWRLFGGDGSGDGVDDPQNVFDAGPAMRRHLCPEGRIGDIAQAVLAYNQSERYVAEVLGWAQTYTGPLASVAVPVAGYALPVPAALISEETLTRPHHDYPAIDIALPPGTPVFSMVAGRVTSAVPAGIYPTDPNRCGTTVVIAGVDGANYTYCHLSLLAVGSDQVIDAGTPLGLSGGVPGTVGAGNTTGPHLHLAIRLSGRTRCPQPLLLAVLREKPLHPAGAPELGCVQSRQAIDWDAWLELVFAADNGQEMT